MAAPTRSVPAPPSLSLVADKVERRLDDVLSAEVERWAALDDALVAPLTSLRQFVLNGGKRLRPAFCHWGFVGAGGDADDPRIVDAGAAFELLQAFALMHDDVMDGSATRRGVASVHVDYATRHDQGGWRGEARRWGEGIAVLVGDLAHVYADRFMAAVGGDAIPIWNELRVELNVGQYLDMVGTAHADTDLTRARRIARYKSGKYTIERPLHVGAAIAGRCDALAPALSAYGDPLGEAFQLRDDLLGAFGDEVQTGKPVGDDLREGKPTPLLALANQRAQGDDVALLSLVGSPDLDARDIAALQDVFVRTGAVAAIEESIDALTHEAIAAIRNAPITSEATAVLVELATYVAWRDR